MRLSLFLFLGSVLVDCVLGIMIGVSVDHTNFSGSFGICGVFFGFCVKDIGKI